MVWEALSTDDDRRVLFVSRSLEEAAAREFGKPLPGRTFSIERAVEEAREVVVVRLLEDGSVMPSSPDDAGMSLVAYSMPPRLTATSNARPRIERTDAPLQREI